MDRPFEWVDEGVFQAMQQHQLVRQLLVQGKTPDEVREVVDFVPGFDMITLQKVATEHPDLYAAILPELHRSMTQMSASVGQTMPAAC